MDSSGLDREAVERAIAEACRRAHAELLEFTVAPRLVTAESAWDGHDWLVEFADAPRAPELFPRALDEALCRLDPAYRAGRTVHGTIAPPRVIELPAGTFHRWRRRCAALGRPGETPRITGNRIIANALLAAAGPLPLITVGQPA